MLEHFADDDGGWEKTTNHFTGDVSLRKHYPIPKGHTKLNKSKPRSHYYHCSNPECQGSLICQTRGFPRSYNPDTADYRSVYSDRLYQASEERFEKACEIAGGGDQTWSDLLPNLSDSDLKEFARAAFGLDKKPTHVRVVYYYDVATGYCCPVVEAIVPKKRGVEDVAS